MSQLQRNLEKTIEEFKKMAQEIFDGERQVPISHESKLAFSELKALPLPIRQAPDVPITTLSSINNYLKGYSYYSIPLHHQKEF
jgi:hypothetical protein